MFTDWGGDPGSVAGGSSGTAGGGSGNRPNIPFTSGRSGGKGSSSAGSRYKKGASSGSQGMSDAGDILTRDADRISGSIQEVKYHRGGKVRKGGGARLLKGERVIPRSKTKRVERLMKRNKMRMKSSGR